MERRPAIVQHNAPLADRICTQLEGAHDSRDFIALVGGTVAACAPVIAQDSTLVFFGADEALGQRSRSLSNLIFRLF